MGQTWLASNSGLSRESYPAEYIKPLYLPPNSPEFNLIERLWQHLKGHYLAGYFIKPAKDLGNKPIALVG